MAQRAARTAATGKKPGGPVPQPPVEGPAPGDQVNRTDPDSRIIQTPGGGFDQCYNAQAVVAAGSLLVVAADAVQAPTDKQQLQPMLNKVAALPEAVGKASGPNRTVLSVRFLPLAPNPQRQNRKSRNS